MVTLSKKRIFTWIDRNPNTINMMNRIYAYIIDWIIGGILSSFPGVFLYAAITKQTDMYTDIYVFKALGYSSMWSYLACFLGIVGFLFYYVWIPYKMYPGQTLGKKLMKLKIITVDGKQLTFQQLLIRQFVGLCLIEGSATIMTRYIRQMITLATSFYFDGPLLVVGFVITVVSISLALFTPSKRSVHDYLSCTLVVDDK